MPATAQIKISADITEFNKAMGQVEGSMGRIQRLTSTAQGLFGGLARTLGRVSGVGLFVGLPATIVASQRAIQKFEKNMLEVYTLLPHANRRAFEQMKKDAIGFSSRFGIPTEEVALGMYQSISAGQNPKGLTDDGSFMEIAMKAAKAGVTDLRTAVDALTTVTNSYGEATYDVQYIADQMFSAVSMSKTTFKEISDYMYQIVPTAAAMKVGIDDLTGSISALAASGTLTRVGTTQLRQFLVELSKRGNVANSAFLQGSGGVPVQTFIRNGGRIIDIIKIMGEVAKKRRTDLRNLFSSVEAGNAALTLYNSTMFAGMDAQQKGGAEGMLETAFGKIFNGMDDRVKRVSTTFMNVFKQIGQALYPVFDDILVYFEGIAEQIKEYDWDGLSANFQIAWHKIKTFLKQDSEFIWEFFRLNAIIALKEVESFLANSLRPALTELSDVMALVFDKDYGMGESLLAMFKGLGKYLVSLATGFGLALMDAFKAPIAFLTASFQSLSKNMYDIFADSLPEVVRNALGIKGKEQRQLDSNREHLSNIITHEEDGAFASKVNDAIFGKDYDDYQNKLEKLQTNLDAVNNGNIPRMTREQLQSKYRNFTNPVGLISESKMSPAVLKQYRLDRGHTQTHRKHIEDQIETLESNPVMPKMGIPSMEEIFDSFDPSAFQIGENIVKTIAGAYPPISDGIGLEHDALSNMERLYSEMMGGDELFSHGVNKKEFMDGKMGENYENVLGLLSEAIEEGAGNVVQKTQLKEYHSALLERRNAMFDEVFKAGVLQEVDLTQKDLMDRYKENAKNIQEALMVFSHLHEDYSEGDQKDAVEQIEKAFQEIKEKSKEILKDAENLETDTPEQKQRRDQLLKKQQEELDALKKARDKVIEDFGLPEINNEKIDFGQDKGIKKTPVPDPLEVMAYRPKVSADSMQSIGGGGGTFGFVRQPIDMLRDSNDKLRDSIDNLRDRMTRDEWTTINDAQKTSNRDADKIQESGFASRVDNPISDIEGFQSYYKNILKQFEMHGIEINDARSPQHDSLYDGDGFFGELDDLYEKTGLNTLMNRMNNMGLGQIFDVEAVMKSIKPPPEAPESPLPKAPESPPSVKWGVPENWLYKTIVPTMDSIQLPEVPTMESIQLPEVNNANDLLSTNFSLTKASNALDQSANRLLSAVDKLDKLQPSIEGVETINFS